MHCNSDKFTERENRTCDGLPDRLRAIAADEMAGRQPVLSPANSHDLLTAADEIERLRTAIRRLAEQDATLSVQGGNVTVTMDALTDEEREAIAWAVSAAEDCQHPADDTLRCLLQRHFPAPENPPAQDNRPRASENLPSGNDAPNLHSNQSEVSVPCTFTAQTEH